MRNDAQATAEAQARPSQSRFRFDLGMPHLGRNNLNENAFFKVVGECRWNQIQTLGGTRSAGICDDEGTRLYATFFYTEIHLPPDRPLAAYGENEVLELQGDLSHCSRTHLDGRLFFLRDGLVDPNSWVRASNVFIYMERGPSKLAVSSPVNLDYSRMGELPSPPDSLDLCRKARARGFFFDPEPDDAPLFEGRREVVYPLDPDRDLNGAGLVYFANFIAFLDHAERRVLSTLPDPLPVSAIDARSTYRRAIGYYGNAQADDRLQIQVGARARVIGGSAAPQLDLSFDYTMNRLSDGKLVVVSSSRKVSPMPVGSEVVGWAKRRGLNH